MSEETQSGSPVTLKDKINTALKTRCYGTIEKLVDQDLGGGGKVAEPFDYLRHWCDVGSIFAYATHDYTWREFEKQFAIIVKTLCKSKVEAADYKAWLETQKELTAVAEKEIGQLKADYDRASHKMEALRCTIETIFRIANSTMVNPMEPADAVRAVEELKAKVAELEGDKAHLQSEVHQQNKRFRAEIESLTAERDSYREVNERRQGALETIYAMTIGAPVPEYLEDLGRAAMEGVKLMAMREAGHGEAMLAMQLQLEEATMDRDGWKQQHENLLAVRDQDLNNLERNAQILEEESTMLRRELRALRQWQESGRGQFLEELRQAIERHEQTQATGQCGNLIQRFDSVLGRYRNKTTWALAKSQQFQNDVLIALRALGFLVQSAGYAHTHREKDALLRGVSMTLETAINKVRDFKFSFQDEWGGRDNEDIFRADFPVRHFIDQINQLRMKIRVLEGPSHRDETVTSDEEEFES